ncbi:kinase C delta type-like [Pelobates cultripes]|uniref:Kinase C delta type-like n=1 Tax=Pelobates cultripes TaxID=61616 RepID=A0AAD1VNP3_PELCU|nr:kinase C delta type-like [Pelobates cultripes]
MLATVGNKSARVAVKVIKKTRMTAERILEERNVLKAAGECPFLCPGLAAFQTPAHAFFVMPHVSGGNLSIILKKEPCLDRHKVKFMSAEMVCGIQFLHRHGIIHRDLKPSNILFERDGHVRIADFGLAATNIFTGDNTTGVTGTLPYMAPEVLLNQAYGPAVDWWSLGTIAFKMLSGRHPFYTSQDPKLYRDCLNTKEPSYPHSFSGVTQDFLSELLIKEPKLRLGVYGDIRAHPFYSGIDWKNVEAENIHPPYQAMVESYGDLTSECREETLSFLNDSNTSEYTEDIPGLSFTSHKWRD